MITLSPSQNLACEAFQVFLKDSAQIEFLLSGFAGSGKSFLVTYLVDLANDEYKLLKLIAPKAAPPNFIYTATTNKATKVLSDMVNHPAKTIHSTLGLTVYNDYTTGKIRLVSKNECKNLNDSILIIDEASMINQELLQFIRAAVKKHKNCKILYVGDSYQLPPVKENNCPVFLTVNNISFLTDIQRQAQNSPIISFSQKYREILDNEHLPWPKIPINNKQIFHYTTGKQWKAAISAAYLQKHDISELKILAWSNNRVRNYNNWLRKQLGYTEPYEIDEKVICNSALTPHDRLLAHTDSIHTIKAIIPETIHAQPGHRLTVKSHTNGDIFEVFQPSNWKIANQLKNAFAQDKDWHKYFEIKNSWADFRPVHAQTVHKSQGSTYTKVFIDIGDIAKNNKWYEVTRLMYVAITRASHEIHLFGKLEERYIRNDPLAALGVFQNAPPATT